MYSSECILDESGITVAPPPRLATTGSLPASITQPSHQTCQCHQDPPAGIEITCKNKVETDGTDSESKTDTSAEASESKTTTSSSDETDQSQEDDEGVIFFFPLLFDVILILYC